MRETQVNQTFLQLLGVDGVLKSQEQSQSLRLDNDNEQLVAELNRQVDSLDALLIQERELTQQEITIACKAYEDKFIVLKEKEAVKEFELIALERESQKQENEF